MATLPDTQPYRFCTTTGWFSVSTLRRGGTASLICNFYHSAAACKVVGADPEIHFACCLDDGKKNNNKTTTNNQPKKKILCKENNKLNLHPHTPLRACRPRAWTNKVRVHTAESRRPAHTYTTKLAMHRVTPAPSQAASFAQWLRGPPRELQTRD